jgi:hypothetical protein
LYYENIEGHRANAEGQYQFILEKMSPLLATTIVNVTGNAPIDTLQGCF